MPWMWYTVLSQLISRALHPDMRCFTCMERESFSSFGVRARGSDCGVVCGQAGSVAASVAEL